MVEDVDGGTDGIGYVVSRKHSSSAGGLALVALQHSVGDG